MSWRAADHPGLGLLVILVVALTAASAAAQDAEQPSPAREPSVFETLFDRSDLGNVAQAAQTSYHAAVRALQQGDKLAEKAAEAPTVEKRERLEGKSRAAYERAVQSFVEAISYDSRLLAAYSGLGQAFRSLGQFPEALQVHAKALQLAPEDADNFRGWATALLALDMLGDATRAYTVFLEQNPDHAAVLMTEMKRWLAARRVDPGELDPQHVERLAGWIAEQEQSSG